MTTKTKSIFITGDIANDYFLVKGKRFYSDDQNQKGTHFNHHKGGAHLIYEFLNKISDARKINPDSEQLDIGFGYNESVFNILTDKNKSYVSVSQYEIEREVESEIKLELENKKEKVKVKVKALRINEFLGFGDNEKNITDLTKENVKPNSEADIFILDDAGIDFSSFINKDVWNSLLESIKTATVTKPDSLVIYKKSSDFDKNDFFDAMIKASVKKELNLLTILSINDIRKLDVKVSAGLSWEQSALDLVAGLNSNEILKYLMRSKYLVITFQSSGALFIVNNGSDNFEYTLIFDPENMEGEDEDTKQGRIIGRISFFTAAFASQINLAKKDKNYKIDTAIKAGLTAVRLFYKIGYVPTNDGVRYPFAEVANLLEKTKDFAYSSAPVPKPDVHLYGQNSKWSVLIDNYSEKKIDEKIQIKALTALAKNIVLKGEAILKNIPTGKFGFLLTIDRNEIESLRNLKKIMNTYITCDEGKKPLSIGVFGPPGAGKSFAVEEIGKGIMGDNFDLKTFNLSQFNDPDDLIGALHQVRDRVLSKKNLIVFWDEFDSQGYKWLQYLLAPMQDGVFQEGQLTHPVGKCIFVFAGATSYSLDSFGKFKSQDAQKEFILKKGPDFMSRLNGYINILGPNKRQIFNPTYTTEEDKWVDDPTDLTYPIRRAIFIIGSLRLKKTDYPFKMDWGLLNALITVDRYKHGSRSLSNLLNDIKQNNPRNLLLRSWLPSKPTLELYFKDPDSFYAGMELESEYLEMVWEVAPLIHSYWYNQLDNPTKEYNVDYSFLPVFIKESNVQAATRIPEVLKTGGFKLIRKGTEDVLSETEFNSILDNDSLLLEKMAEKEHELWMEFYTANGWIFDEIRNDYAKKHNCIKLYSELPDKEKKKDRGFIKKYPIILDMVGFGVAKE